MTNENFQFSQQFHKQGVTYNKMLQIWKYVIRFIVQHLSAVNEKYILRINKSKHVFFFKI